MRASKNVRCFQTLNVGDEEQSYRRFSERQILILMCILATLLLLGAIIVNKFFRGLDENEYKAKVERLLRETIELIKDLRGLSLEDVQVEVITIDWAKENWGRSFAEADRENILREEKIYKALFMISEDESLYEARVEWWGMIVSAVWQNKIYVVKEYFNPYDRFNAEKTLLHELTHMMQSKYFDIPYIPTFDGDKAKAALIEGDACLMEEAFVNRTKGGILMMGMFSTPHVSFGETPPAGEIGVYARLPDSVSRLNYFPYEYGLKFVKALYAEDGWQGVNHAYGNPPTTTEQIMHPEKYFISESSRLVEAPTMVDEDWQKIKNDRFGEYFILVMLENWLPSTEAARAAGGWGGDNFTYYERGADYLLTWNITWDSQEDTSEFSTSFKTMMNAVGAEEEAKNLWQKYGRYLSLACEGNSTLIVCSTDKTLVQKIADYGTNHSCEG